MGREKVLLRAAGSFFMRGRRQLDCIRICMYVMLALSSFVVGGRRWLARQGQITSIWRHKEEARSGEGERGGPPFSQTGHGGIHSKVCKDQMGQGEQSLDTLEM